MPPNSLYPYRILIIGGSEYEKTNALYNLINHKLYTDKIYLYVKDLYEAKYQLLIQKQESAGLKHCNNDYKAFIFMKILKSIIQIKNATY